MQRNKHWARGIFAGWGRHLAAAALLGVLFENFCFTTPWPNPSRQDFIRAMESLLGFDPELGVKLEFSSTNQQGLHKVWLDQTAQGRSQPVPAP